MPAKPTKEFLASNTATDRDLERHGATLEVTE